MEKKSKRGGKRPGAGRKPMSGIYGEKTEPIRLPVSKIAWVRQLMFDSSLAEPLLLLEDTVSAGCPFTQRDIEKSQFDLKTYLDADSRTSYLVKAAGDSMINAGIFDQDLLTISMTGVPKHNDIVIARIDGAVTVKRYIIDGEKKYLKAENPACSDIPINVDQDVALIGTVIGVIRKL